MISVVIVILGRPLAIKLIYKLIYEPNSRVEDFDYTINTETLNLKFDSNKLKTITYDHKDDFEKADMKLSLPKVFDNDVS